MTDEKDKCDHGITFDRDKAHTMTSNEVRKTFPRLYGQCLKCNYYGIAYASMEHYVAGDW